MLSRLTVLLLFTLTMSTAHHLAAQAESTPIAEWQEKWANAAAYTLEVAELMPAADYTYQPTEDQMNFGNQLRHMAGNVRWISIDLLGYAPADSVAAALETGIRADSLDKAATLQLLTTVFALADRAVAGLAPGDEETVVDFFAGPKTKRQLMALMQDHLTHHRGQVIVYLRLKGIKPPKYRGW